MKSVSPVIFLLAAITALPAQADAPEWSQFLGDQLRRVGDAAPAAGALGGAELAHVFLTVRAEVDFGLKDIGAAALQPELIFVFASPDAKP